MTFEGIIGHRATLDLLRGEASSPGHAYLFSGMAGVGKATIAQHFAASLICDSDRCASRVLRHSHPDVILIGPDGKTALGVEQARAAIARATLHPVEGDRKVFIFDDAELMTDAAANALLKTLEEPSASTVFILVADSEDDLPMTVASRCRTIRFGRVAAREIVEALIERGVELERAEETARIAGGSPGLALAFATQPEAGEFRRRWLSIPGRVTGHPGDAFRLADEMLGAGTPLLVALEEQQAAELAALELGRPRSPQGNSRSPRACVAAGHICIDGVGSRDAGFLVCGCGCRPARGSAAQSRSLAIRTGQGSTRTRRAVRRVGPRRGLSAESEPTTKTRAHLSVHEPWLRYLSSGSRGGLCGAFAGRLRGCWPWCSPIGLPGVVGCHPAR